MDELIPLLATPALAMLVVRLLLVRPPVPSGLPNPAKIGLPSGRLASPAAVHAVLGGGAVRPWWRFW